MKNYLISIIVFILLTSMVFAGTTSYPHPSGEDYTWALDGRGVFSGIGTQVNILGQSLTSPVATPVIDDLDDDSLIEIVILDDDSIKAFRKVGNILSLVDVLDLGDTMTDVSNVLSYDIDGDNLKEIIFLDATGTAGVDNMMIINYSESDGFQVQRIINVFSALGSNADLPQIACRDANECFTTLTSSYLDIIFDPFTHIYYGATFDSMNFTSGLLTIYSEFQTSGDGIALCSPRIKNIVVKDFDLDGDDDFIFSFGKKEESDDDITIFIRAYDNATETMSGSIDSVGLNTATDGTCSGADAVPNLITSPVVANIRNDDGQVDEIYVGLQTDNDQFRINIFKTDGTWYHQIPDLFEADGKILSNPIIMNAFPETDDVDVCMLGYVAWDDSILPICDSRQCVDLLCGTQDRGWGIGDDDEFAFDIDGTFNITTDINKQNVIAHAVQHNNNDPEGSDLDEILSAYGIFEIIYEGANRLERTWINPSGDSIALSIDLDDIQDDILTITDTNIIIYDDRTSNNPALFTSTPAEYNPCVLNNAIIKVNETLRITANAEDMNDEGMDFYDDLNFNIYVYEGTSNEMNDSHRDVPTSQVTGLTSVFSDFVLNKTGNSNRIFMEVWDTANPSEIDTYENVFNVGLAGLEFGDVTCEHFVERDECERDIDCDSGYICTSGVCVIEECVRDSQCPNDYSCVGGDCIEDDETLPVIAMQEASNVFNIPVGALYIMFMLALALGIWFAPIGKTNNFFDSANARFGTIIIGEAMMLILGTIFGFVHIAVLLSIVILSVIAFAVWVVRRVSGTGTQ